MHSINVPEDHFKGEKPARENDGKISASADKRDSISVGSKEDAESEQIKLDIIRSEMKLIVDFLEWCERRLDEMSSCKYEDNYELRVISAIVEFTKGVESHMSDFPQYRLHKRRMSQLTSLQLLFIDSLLTALCSCEKLLSPREKK